MKTSVNLAGVELKNPVMTASGTFGSGAEYSEFVDLKELGAVVTKVKTIGTRHGEKLYETLVSPRFDQMVFEL